MARSDGASVLSQRLRRCPNAACCRVLPHGMVCGRLRTLLLFLCETCTNTALGETGPRVPPKINQRCDGEVGAKASLRSAWVRSVRLGSLSPLTPLGVLGGTGVARE